MPTPETLPAFTPEQTEKAHNLLAATVAYMMGRKFEEGDWANIYCRAKGIPNAGWSNLNIDVMHNGLGIEHKMICFKSDVSLAEAYGRTFMHPSATRSIRIASLDVEPNVAMKDILTQYADLIKERTAKVQETAPKGRQADMRTGWLIWQESLRQFLYFEERTFIPNPADYTAEWSEKAGGTGGRKGSKNLWIYEKATGKKRYSITTSAGAKIQPYFDVPPPTNPNVYLFTVIGEVIATDVVRAWITTATLRELKRYVAKTDTDSLSAVIMRELTGENTNVVEEASHDQSAEPLLLRKAAYARLKSAFPSVNDDHSFQLLIQHLANKA